MVSDVEACKQRVSQVNMFCLETHKLLSGTKYKLLFTPKEKFISNQHQKQFRHEFVMTRVVCLYGKLFAVVKLVTESLKEFFDGSRWPSVALEKKSEPDLEKALSS